MRALSSPAPVRAATCLRCAAALALGACAIAPEHPQAARSPELAFLDRLVGRWDVTRTMADGVAHNTLEARWVLGRQFVELHWLDRAEPPEYEALVLVGYDTQRARFVAHWCDSFGAGASCDGYGLREGERVEFRFDYPSGPFFNEFRWHPESGHWSFRGENGKPDGTRELFMQDDAQPR